MGQVSYIDFARSGNKLVYSTRNKLGVRVMNEESLKYQLFVEVNEDEYDGEGWINTHEKPVNRIICSSRSEHRTEINRAISQGKEIWESDAKPEYVTLENMCPDKSAPKLHVSIFDIEVDSNPEDGFPEPHSAAYPINAVSIHNKWLKDDGKISLLLHPENMTIEQARDLLAGKVSQDKDGNIIDCPPDDEFGVMDESDGYFIFESEKELLFQLYECWEDADVLSGWNSKFFDIPYIIQRSRIVLGEEDPDVVREDFLDPELRNLGESESFINGLAERFLSRLSSLHLYPDKRSVQRYGNTEYVYDMKGTIDLDYLDLYKKYTLDQKHSYSLDSILELEIGETKVAYEGSLYDLYRKDYRRFVAYSRQDTMGLSKMDDEKQFINLANSMAHMAGVRIPDALGSVVIIERAMAQRFHDRKIALPNHNSYMGEKFPVPGAFVLDPRPGLFTDGGVVSYDYNSLYPSIIRTLNIDPMTIVAYLDISETLKKFKHYVENEKMTNTEAWARFLGTIEYQRVITDSEESVIVCMEREYENIRNERNEIIGRKPTKFVMSGKDVHDMIKEEGLTITPMGLIISNETYGVIPQTLTEWYEDRVEAKKEKARLKKEMESIGDSINEEEKHEYEVKIANQETLQQSLKLMLNSTYGAMGNSYFRMFDPRMAASITLGGRACLLSMAYGLEYLLDTLPYPIE